MNIRDLKAMISLLDDNDPEVVGIINDRIMALGADVIPDLEREWEFYGENPAVQNKIEDILHQMQLGSLMSDFKEWVSHGGEDLLRGLWLVCRLDFPEVKIEKLSEEINKIYTDIWVKSKEDIHPLDLLKIMNDVIFNQFGYEPNIKRFHAPQNSLFNLVLEQRKGNPASLSCLYILLAQKLDIPLYGVNLPNLFITIYDIPGHRVYVNPFNKGQIFHQKDIDDYLKQMKIEPREEYYVACSNIDIIRRVLTNLAFAYQKSGDLTKESQVNQIIDFIKTS